jgi:mannose-6-phosphate isomerase-like protein (cupin superfamily)
MSKVKNIGEKVRKFREFKNLSQEELAERSKLSKELISMIEENKEMPFLAPLIRIARSLGVRLGTLLDDSIEPGPVVVRGEINKPVVNFSHKGSTNPSHMSFSPLASDKAGRHMEPFMVDIKPTGENDFTLSSHDGEEFLFVLSGEIELSYGKEVFKIGAGDSIYYDSVVGHHVHSANNKPARILAVIYAPI